MRKNQPEKSGEDLHKRYKSLIKKISDQDLRDMLTVLYSEPSLVMNNPDFEKLNKIEQKSYAEKSAMLSLINKNRRNQLLSKLEKDFHIFDKEFIKNPLLEKTPEVLKPIIEEMAITFPKASLLIDVIKSTLNLRETGEEVPDELKIKVIEFFTSDHSKNDYQIVINGDYKHPLKVNKHKNVWRMFFDLAENGYLDRNKETKRVYDYVNYHPDSPFRKNTKYPVQKIIVLHNGSYEPSFKTSIQTEKALVQRQNKSKSLLRNT